MPPGVARTLRVVTALVFPGLKYEPTGVVMTITQGLLLIPTPIPGSAHVKGRTYTALPCTKSAAAHAGSYDGEKPMHLFLPTSVRTAVRNMSGGNPGMNSPFMDASMRFPFSSGRNRFREPSGWGKAFSPSKHPIPYWLV